MFRTKGTPSQLMHANARMFCVYTFLENGTFQLAFCERERKDTLIRPIQRINVFEFGTDFVSGTLTRRLFAEHSWIGV